MPEAPPEFIELLEDQVRPNHTDRMRARQLILEMLRDGRPRGIGRLQAVLLEAEGVPRIGAATGTVNVEGATAAAIREVEMVRSARLSLAAAEAVQDLAETGFLSPVTELPTEQQSEKNPIIGGGLSIRYVSGNLTAKVTIKTYVPSQPGGCRLAPRHKDREAVWYLDTDIFLEDVHGLGLPEPTERALNEALAAYRAHLYLACVSLLGAVSEAAWFAAAARLRPTFDSVDKALSREPFPTAASVIDTSISALEGVKGLKLAAHSLGNRAELFRALRNYGAHPRDDMAEHLERHIGEASTGTLILTFHQYLVDLDGATTRALSERDA